MDNMKHNIHIIGVLEVQETEPKIDNLFKETMTENF